MTIEYALTRTEIVQGYFRSLLGSPRYARTILLYAVVLGVIVALERGAFSRCLTSHDVVIGALSSVGFLLLLPALLFIRGKTSRRSLTITPDGISTEIGSLKGQVDWREIKVITETDHYILIARSTGNAFFIPNRAFPTPWERAEFVSKIKGWTLVG